MKTAAPAGRLPGPWGLLRLQGGVVDTGAQKQFVGLRFVPYFNRPLVGNDRQASTELKIPHESLVRMTADVAAFKSEDR